MKLFAFLVTLLLVGDVARAECVFCDMSSPLDYGVVTKQFRDVGSIETYGIRDHGLYGNYKPEEKRKEVGVEILLPESLTDDFSAEGCSVVRILARRPDACRWKF